MKTIGIDARLYFQTGVGTYLRNFLHYFEREPGNGFRYRVYIMEKDAGKIRLPNPSFELVPVPYLWHSLAEQTGYLSRLMADNNDLMHFTYFGYPVLYKRPFLATVHDVTPLTFKTGKASTRGGLRYAIKHLGFRHVLSTQVRNARFIITPSRAVKDQLGELYGEKTASKVIPLHLGVGYELTQAKSNEKLGELYGEDFFIYVGNFYPHKNITRLIDAYRLAGIGGNLILIGPHDFFTETISRAVYAAGLDGKVRFHHDASFEDLVYFYSHARALIHPSLSEGFGLPVIEAAHFGCQVIASDIPVFRELLGRSYRSFDPYDTKDIARAIQGFVKNPSTHDMRKVASMYSFRDLAIETRALYSRILSV